MTKLGQAQQLYTDLNNHLDFLQGVIRGYSDKPIDTAQAEKVATTLEELRGMIKEAFTLYDRQTLTIQELKQDKLAYRRAIILAAVPTPSRFTNLPQLDFSSPTKEEEPNKALTVNRYLSLCQPYAKALLSDVHTIFNPDTAEKQMTDFVASLRGVLPDDWLVGFFDADELRANANSDSGVNMYDYALRCTGAVILKNL